MEEEKKQESLRKKLEGMINEYQGDCYWSAEGWGDKVPTEDDLEKEMELLLDFIEQEIDKAREEGRREVYEAIVFDKNIPHDVTTFVAANLWKNMRDKAKEELSKLTTK